MSKSEARNNFEIQIFKYPNSLIDWNLGFRILAPLDAVLSNGVNLEFSA